ncbi:unnamed protein product [Bursaphelenchus xylophilus]|uniref:(pine wood nematode) hypothetical protein n=1 Tax=Bursaphelenchus xylophilus TaxID=6326 RepID=A0A1I7RTH9_BURXY|nr:unnamed protein product [Bursaphelenchus xylophilus]CAG9122445.1 unnamed protein product [Bursaphelenchus xylophilus]
MNYSRDWDKMRSEPFFTNREFAYDAFKYWYAVFGGLNFLLNMYFVIRIFKTTILHINFRISVCNTVISLEFMHITLMAGTYYNDLTIHLENRFYVNIGCAFLALLNNIASASGAISMFMLALERQLAHRWVNVYEDKPRTLGCALGMLVVIQSTTIGLVAWYFFLFYLEDFDVHASRISCIPTHLHWEWEVGGFVLATGSCLLGAVWFCALKRNTSRDRRDRLSLRSLSARYQATENSYTTASIAPSMVMYTFGAILGMAVGFYRGHLVGIYGENTIMSKFLGDIGFLFVDIYALCHLLCILCYNPMIRNAIKKDFDKLICNGGTRTAAKTDYTHETEIYFEQIKDAWA